MGKQAELFLAAFNRVEKWLQHTYGGQQVPGFSELVRRLSKNRQLQVARFQDDLLEIAQLRNAIVHDRISPTFVIAEPNEWIVNKLLTIEKELTKPDYVLPKYRKKVMTFDEETSLKTILKSVNDNGFLQFPIYGKGVFKGLITAKGIGTWLAKHVENDMISIKNQTARAIIASDKRRDNVWFVSAKTYDYQIGELFASDPSLEAILITKTGQKNEPLLGLIRPKDVFDSYYKERGE